MAGYLGAVPVPQATQHRDTFTATDGQTTFNVQPYTPTFLDVYLNGVRLNAADVTATNGTSVVLVACETDDIVDVISYAAFEVGSLSANSVDSDQYVDGSIDTVHIADVNVTQGKIADQAINEAKLQVSNAPTNGYFLSAQSGNTGGMTWAQPSGTPSGAVIYHAANSPPTGFLKANGAAISRSTYAALFAVIGTTYGAGDGSSTFLVPDLRGEFLRGWDDGRGVDGSRAFGSAQADAFKAHTHGLVVKDPSNQSTGGAGPRSQEGGDDVQTFNTTSTGDTETRPRNIALLACIKY